jgi:hypothetical protein
MPSWAFNTLVMVFIVIPPLVLLAAEVWERVNKRYTK